MTRNVLHHTIALLLIWTLLAPTLGEVACVDVCTGSACEGDVLIEFCETDSANDCCSPARTAGEAVESAPPNLAVMGDACTMCPCFEDRPFDVFILSDNYNLSQLTPAVLDTPRPDESVAVPSPRVYGDETLIAEAHGPPLYQKHRALLL
jgi:hypothetical protein